MGSRPDLQVYHANVSMATKRLFTAVLATIKSVTIATDPVQSVEFCFNDALQRFVEELKYAYVEFTKTSCDNIFTLEFEHVVLTGDSILSSDMPVKAELTGVGGSANIASTLGDNEKMASALGGNENMASASGSNEYIVASLGSNENMALPLRCIETVESKNDMDISRTQLSDSDSETENEYEMEAEPEDCDSENDVICKFEKNDSEDKLNETKSIKKLDSKTVCEKCNKSFANTKKLRRHIQRSCRPKEESERDLLASTYCQMCQKFFSTKGNLTKHMKMRHSLSLSPKRKTPTDPATPKEAPSLMCRICDQPYYTQSGLFKHMRKKHIKVLQNTTCDVCDEEFSNTSQLDKHLLDEHKIDNSEKFICKVCSDVFHNEVVFTAHAKTHLEDVEDLRKCEACDLTFGQPYLLRKHNVKIHGMSTPYKCQECSRYFLAQSKLDTHVAAKHGGCKEYTCEFCGKAFSCNDGLKQHRVLHGIKTDFHCQTCDRYFAHKSMLRRHIETKHGEKQTFVCSQCGKVFSHLKTLNDHYKKHAQNQPQ